MVPSAGRRGRNVAASMKSMTMDAAFPRLRRLWSGTWRLLLAVVMGLFAFLVTYGSIIEIMPTGELNNGALGMRMLADAALGVVALVLYPFRHRAPLLIALVICASTFVSALALGASTLVIASISTRRRVREIVPVAVLSLVAGVIAEITLPQTEELPPWAIALMSTLSIGVVVVTGLYIGGRRQLHHSLREQVQSERRERAAHIEQARASERTRIAREMHDTLAHRLSLVSLHAGALEFRTDLSHEQIAQTAATVRENAQLAGDELRAVLGVLRDPEYGTLESTGMLQPSLRNLDELLAVSERAGNPVDLVVDADVDPLWHAPSETLSRTVFRVIQEAVTNARKHAPHTRVSIRVSGESGEFVALTIRNPIEHVDSDVDAVRENSSAEMLAAPASGLGLVGLAERVRLVGGTLERDPGAHENVFTLKVWFPWNT